MDRLDAPTEPPDLYREDPEPVCSSLSRLPGPPVTYTTVCGRTETDRTQLARYTDAVTCPACLRGIKQLERWS